MIITLACLFDLRVVLSYYPTVDDPVSATTLLMKNIGLQHIVSYVTLTLFPVQSLPSNTVMFKKSLVQLLAGMMAVGGQGRLAQADGEDVFEANIMV